MAETYVMRPSRLDDLQSLIELAELSGPGFTSLPVDVAILRERLQKSDDAFLSRLHRIEYGKYLLMMENAETGEVVGCSAVKAGTGIDQPFFNYRVITLAQASQAAGNLRFDMDALVLTNEYVGYTEVGTLFLKPEHRGGGAGRLAAQSRYLLMAAEPGAFRYQGPSRASGRGGQYRPFCVLGMPRAAFLPNGFYRSGSTVSDH